MQRTKGQRGRKRTSAPLIKREKLAAANRTQSRSRFSARNPIAELFQHIPRKIMIIAASALCAALVLTGTGAVVAYASSPTPIECYEVFVGGRSVGFAADKDAVSKAYSGILQSYGDSCGMQAVCAQELSFQDVVALEDNILDASYIGGLMQKIMDIKVRAAVISVNGRGAAAVCSESDAQSLLSDILTSFKSGEGEVSFIERVEVSTQCVYLNDVLSTEDARQTLTKGVGYQDIWYEVQKGDSLQKIASDNSLTLAELMDSNPDIDDDNVIQPGQKINLAVQKRWVNVKYSCEVTQEETVPFETETKKSDSMYTNQTKVEQPGSDGKAKVTRLDTYLNGRLMQRTEIKRDVISEAVNKIVVVGTKTVPKAPTATSAGTWSLPLKSGTYRISSTFGTRTLNGVTRSHKGIDMAASTGTPIYAAMDGTVHYSGTASGYGLVVYLNSAGGIQTRYGHCSKLLVKAGDTVKKGDKIALVGNTGDSTGPHCHFEVRINGTAVNPLG